MKKTLSAIPINRIGSLHVNPLTIKRSYKNAENQVETRKDLEFSSWENEELVEFDLIETMKRIDDEIENYSGFESGYVTGLGIAKEIILTSLSFRCKNGHHIHDEYDAWARPKSKLEYFYDRKCYMCELESGE